MPGSYRDDPPSDDEDQRWAERFEDGERRIRRVWDGFLDFALQGNILEIAFGLILAAAFTSIINSLVSDILLPPLSVLFPLNKNLDEKFAVLKPGPNFDPANGGYPTIQLAQEDSAVVMAWGSFVNKVLNFLGLGVSLYALAGLYQYFSNDPIIKHLKKCPYCKKRRSAASTVQAGLMELRIDATSVLLPV
ncbi:hypothetical protein MCOR19_001517 [Pyricularia oryzae]|nr:hypothetical protein MCOR19_001517 [Pyricularia oryzae]